MEVVTGALPSIIAKLSDLLIGEFNLQKWEKGEIRFLQTELQSMQGALEKHSSTPADQHDIQDKIWARDLRELSYDIEDSIDTFMVHGKSSELAWPHGFKELIGRSYYLFSQFQVRRKIAIEIRDIKRRVIEVGERRDRYKIKNDVAKPVTVDPRLLARYEKVTKLVGIDNARDEVVKILMEGDESSKQHGKTISIVGFGGLGKTTLANVVYEKLRPQFDCSAFVSVSQTPDMEKLFNDMFYQLAKTTITSINAIDKLREFLEKKRYFIIIDDIWDISVWKMIKCSLPDNDSGHKIITTTRVLSVAEYVGGPYKLKPLCVDDSRKLLYRRIFGEGNKDKCPSNKELVEISNKILNKCAGVPLAIITTGSLLASKGRNEMDWYHVYNSIGSGLENCLDVDNMRKILSLSYYDLPPNLRTCLLYLSVFPEDYKMEKDNLIWMWIAEGFIQCEKRGKSLFELGEGYFNELINRSLIQPIYDGYNAMIKYCRVHDMILDLICSLSCEQNFVTILNAVDHTSPSEKVRRLSLQKNKVDHATYLDAMSMQQVRSVVVFPSAFHLMPSLQSFRVLRVLDLDSCDLSQACSFMCLGNLFHLRYLGLRNTRIAHLPAEIGSMVSLQTLDVRCNDTCSLPLAVHQLKCLMCLRISNRTIVPNGIIGNLTSIEELSTFSIYNDCSGIIEELGHLTELRVLDIVCQPERADTTEKSLVELLCKLHKIQSLDIIMYGVDYCNLDPWVTPPHHLHRLRLEHCWFSTLPNWMNPSLQRNLSFLWISVRELKQEDLEILGRLPALGYLNLKVHNENLGILGSFFVGAGSFPCLVFCSLWGFGGPVVFKQGAMRRLTSLRFTFPIRETREIAGNNVDLALGLGNLTSLQDVIIRLRSVDASKEKVEEVRTALRHVAETHPNHPTVELYD
ncbi:unnamed protein product [Urochloa decumbens]|uniref:Uncharacterized protein n=1 Tax=Urochloa decumbens TaxID=240449 RepID=A0ABC9ANV3_9POAL